MEREIQDYIDTHRMIVESPNRPNINENPLLMHFETKMLEMKNGSKEFVVHTSNHKCWNAHEEVNECCWLEKNSAFEIIKDVENVVVIKHTHLDGWRVFLKGIWKSKKNKIDCTKRSEQAYPYCARGLYSSCGNLENSITFNG